MDPVRSYIERVLALRREREEDALDDRELEQIALEAGLSSTDLAEAREAADDHLTRGEGFLRHGNWKRAVAEFEGGVALSPNRAAGLSGLALALWNHGCTKGKTADRHRAMQYAERALQINPGNDEIIGLVTHMTEHPDTVYRGPVRQNRNTTNITIQTGSRRGFLVVGLALVALVGAIVPVFFLLGDKTMEGPSSQTIEVPSADPTTADLQIGRSGIGSEGFDDARYIGIDKEDELYVADFKRGIIQTFDAEGETKSFWTIPSQGPIVGFDVDATGTAWAIVDGFLRRFDGDGGIMIDEPAADMRPYSALAAHPTGGAVAMGRGKRGRGELLVFGPDGSIELRVEDPIGRITETTAVLPMIAVATDGRIFLLDRQSKGVFAYRADGTYIDRFAGADGSAALRAPTAIAVDRLGRIVVADITGITIFTDGGEVIERLGLKGPIFGLAVDSRNRLWVARRTHIARFALPS